MTSAKNSRVELDGRTLTPSAVARIAKAGEPVSVSSAGLARARGSHALGAEIATRQRVYGRNTGVGANRLEGVAADELARHGLRLLRSHAGGVGALLPNEQVRAMLAVRANQILAGGSGVQPDLAAALVLALNSGHLPEIHDVGSLGTGDLSALAELGLTVLGERPWGCGDGAPPQPVELAPGDALAFISSNALTIGQAVLAWHEIEGLLHAAHVVAGLSLLATQGNMEAFAEAVHEAQPHAASAYVAGEIRRLVGTPRTEGSRIQDPLGYRCVPQVHGPAVAATNALEHILGIEINAAAENPLISLDAQAAFHHGGFHCATLALALDSLRIAVLQTARLSTARLATLVEPAFTGLRPFLVDDSAGSSGVMILEYHAASALDSLRSLAYPAALGHSVISRGVEEHASYASQAARQSLAVGPSYRLVLACELVAAMRALRQRKTTYDAEDVPVWKAFSILDARLNPAMGDRPLGDDVSAVAALLDDLADV